MSESKLACLLIDALAGPVRGESSDLSVNTLLKCKMHYITQTKDRNLLSKRDRSFFTSNVTDCYGGWVPSPKVKSKK